ncbi:hypothetical protein [Psychrobacillus phage Perkons]|nr:hypothetical protein [Psychrobacillus phage Perkons]
MTRTNKENNVVFYSGGLGSFATTLRVIEKHGKENLTLLFTDTLIEDHDLYRFIIETAGHFFDINKEMVKGLSNRALKLTMTESNMKERKIELEELRLDTNRIIPQLVWLTEHKDPWDIFFEQKFLGNSRIAQCSHIIKQVLSKKYIKKNFNPENTTLYLGIDWTEDHRTKAPTKNWYPYKVEFPMCEEPYVNKIDVVKELEEIGIETPRLYGMKFVHNNCGGFCVRAGQGHFANLLEQNRPLFLYHEQREQEIRKLIGKDVSMIRKQKKGVRYNYTLRDLRLDLEAGNDKEVDFTDIGGCGCFVTEDEESIDEVTVD